MFVFPNSLHHGYTYATPCKTLISIQLMDSNVYKRNKRENILYKVKVLFKLTDVFWYCCRYSQGKENIKRECTSGTSLSHADKWTAQFYGRQTPCIKSESSAEAGYTKSTQTCYHPSVSVDMSEIVIENVGHSKKSIMFYNELPDFITVQGVFEIESLIEHGAEKMCTQSVSEMTMYSLRQNTSYGVLMSL